MDIADLQAQLIAYGDFDYPVDVAKAHKYAQTCRRILSLGIRVWYVGSNRMEFDWTFLRAEIVRAEQFIVTNSATPVRAEVVHQSLRCFRD